MGTKYHYDQLFLKETIVIKIGHNSVKVFSNIAVNRQ